MENPKRWPSVTIFVIMQVAWVTLVTLWFAWYSSRWAKGHLGTLDIVIIVEVSILLLLILAGILALFILFQHLLNLMRTQMLILSSITHEFKTPLATTQLYLETLKKRDLPDETRKELIDGMLLENQRLKNLVENFLESARASSRRKPYKLLPTSLSSYLDQFLQRHAALIKGVSLSIDVPEDLNVALDKNAFDIVLSNLSTNAINYSTKTPVITIRAWREGRWVYINFSDSGMGIPKEHRRDVFKMFQRLPEGVAMLRSGTGMGLYVVKTIIKAHGGRIEVDDLESPGTTFLIRLPGVKQ